MSATEPQAGLDPHNAAFVQHRVAIIAASCDVQLRPALARGLGCRVSADGLRARVLVSTQQSLALQDCIRASGQLAVVFTQPSTHRALQVKARDAVVEPASADDLAILKAYLRYCLEEVCPLGYSEAFVRTLFTTPPEDALAIAFTVAEVYVQTPGPAAGLRSGTTP